MEVLEKLIVQKIQQNKDPNKAKWLEKYVKHNVKSYGVGIPVLRDILTDIAEKASLPNRSLSEQLELMNLLMTHGYTEPKLTAILYAQLYLKMEDISRILPSIEAWFDEGDIFDWNVCDWLCTRFLTTALNEKPTIMIPTLKGWIFDTGIWKSRAALVSFAEASDKSKHLEDVQMMCRVLIKREERFCKTAVGWALRTYSKEFPDFVKTFLEEYQEFTTAEVRKNATTYF